MRTVRHTRAKTVPSNIQFAILRALAQPPKDFGSVQFAVDRQTENIERRFSGWLNAAKFNKTKFPAQLIGSLSLFAEDANGLDARGAIGRNDCGEDADEQKKKSDGGKREGVRGANAVNERSNEAAQRQCSGEA